MLKLLKKWSWAVVALIVAGAGAWYWRRRQMLVFLRDVHTLSWENVAKKYGTSEDEVKRRYNDLNATRPWARSLATLPKW